MDVGGQAKFFPVKSFSLQVDPFAGLGVVGSLLVLIGFQPSFLAWLGDGAVLVF